MVALSATKDSVMGLSAGRGVDAVVAGADLLALIYSQNLVSMGMTWSLVLDEIDKSEQEGRPFTQDEISLFENYYRWCWHKLGGDIPRH
jgi:hypothetical protein